MNRADAPTPTPEPEPEPEQGVDAYPLVELGCPLFDPVVVRDIRSDHERVVEMTITSAVRGPSGAVHGGVLSTLVDYVACSLLARLSDRPLATSSANITFLAAGVHGPLRASATPLRISRHQGVADVRIIDVGRDDRVVATATVIVAFLEGAALRRRGEGAPRDHA